jgi:hypothetical protein
VFPQETGYQRNDLVREASELTVESGLRLWMENINTDTFYNFNLNAGYEAGLSFSMTGIKDPVVWDIGVRYALGLPKEERYHTTWRPGTIQASLAITDLFNDRFGFSVGLSETVILPRMIGMSMEPGGPVLRTGLKLEALILFEHDYVRLSAEGSVFPTKNLSFSPPFRL